MYEMWAILKSGEEVYVIVVDFAMKIAIIMKRNKEIEKISLSEVKQLKLRNKKERR
jgi:hypothetical protein